MRIIIFFDFVTIYKELEDMGIEEIDYSVLIDYLAAEDEQRIFMSGFAYFPIDPENPTKNDSIVEELKAYGFQIRKKEYKTDGLMMQCDFGVDLALDCAEIFYNNKADIILIFSNNENLIPLIKRIKDRGTRIEIASFMKSAIIEYASGFININNAIQEDIELENKE
jgi:uncharacterized LabA/DUF88 family protein